MTEPILATAVPATALAVHLTAVGHAPALISYLGALTPRTADASFDAPGAETDAALTGAAVHDLGWLRRIAVRGEDRMRWLSGMVTNTVEGLPNRSGAYNLVLNAQGRIQGDAYVWREGEEFELEVTAEQAEPLLAHLDHFIIMDDVEIVPLTGQSALGLTGPLAGKILENLGLAGLPELVSNTHSSIAGVPVQLFRSFGTQVPHYQLWTSTEHLPTLWHALQAAGATTVGAAALETVRVVEGIPAYGVDIQSRDLPQETSQDRALHFTKGCYLGQEIVERIRSRGQVHRHLRHMELTLDDPAKLPPVSAELRIAGSDLEAKAAGTLTSVAVFKRFGNQRVFAIGMVRAEAEMGNKTLTFSGGTAQIFKSIPALKLSEQN